jgi:hypothetical protein
MNDGLGTAWNDAEEPTDLLATFTGRERELAHLSGLLQDTHSLPVFVSGQCGVGKTALTLAYAQRFRLEYSRRVHVSCSTVLGASVEKVLADRLRYFSSTASRENRGNPILASVRSLKKPVLLVFDEVDLLSERDYLHIRKYLEPLLPRVRVIFIAQRAGYLPRSSRESRRVIELKPLSFEAASEALRLYALRAGINGDEIKRFLASLSSIHVDWDALSPRFILQLFDNYLRSGKIDEALLESLKRYFRPVTSFAIKASGEETKVLPIGQLDPVGIITPQSRIFTAFPFVEVPSYSRLWRRTIEELENLLNNKETTESQLQIFFERNPQFLKGIDYEDVIAHPVLERDGDGDLIPDFFLKPRGRELIDIVDLKLPRAKLLVGKKDRKKVSGSVSEAIAQVREYRDYFERPEYRERIARKYGVRAYRPTTIVVIGRQPSDHSEEKVQQIFSDLPSHVRLMTYDDIWNRAKAFAEQNSI